MTGYPLLQAPPTRLLRPLPRPVRPIHDEQLDSFLRRLSAANRLDPKALRTYLAEGDTHAQAPIPLQRLAILAGYPPLTLARAINPGALPASDPARGGRPIASDPRRPACRLCVARHGAHSPVIVALRPDHLACLRHLRWIGDGHPGPRGTQPSLVGQRAVVAANRIHRRMTYRHGRAGVQEAMRDAEQVCAEWRNHGLHDQPIHDVLARFHGPTWNILPSDPTLEAARYPQLVALAALLVSPTWRHMLGDPHHQDTVVADIRRTVAPRYTWPSHGDDALTSLQPPEAAHA